MQSSPRTEDQIWSVFLKAHRQDLPLISHAFESLNATLSWPENPETDEIQLEVFLTPEEKTFSEEDIKALLKNTFDAFDLSLPITSIKKLPHKNWLEENRKQFPPIHCGRFFVYPTFFEGSIPEGKISIQLNAATAFGSGEHQTTQGCLLALERLTFDAPSLDVLDMGCGSGILGIAAAKLWPSCHVWAADFDQFAVKSTAYNAQQNHVKNLTALLSDGFADMPQKHYDLVLANILAGPLIEMAADIARHTKEKGKIVLSGLLERQAEEVKAAYYEQELNLEDAYSIGGWSTLIFSKD